MAKPIDTPEEGMNRKISEILDYEKRFEEITPNQLDTLTEDGQPYSNFDIFLDSRIGNTNIYYLIQPVSSKWRELGAALGMIDEYLDYIADRECETDMRLLAVVHKWRGSHYYKYSYQEIITALNRIGEFDITQTFLDLADDEYHNRKWIMEHY